jgi:hypothetical protein
LSSGIRRLCPAPALLAGIATAAARSVIALPAACVAALG